MTQGGDVRRLLVGKSSGRSLARRTENFFANNALTQNRLRSRNVIWAPMQPPVNYNRPPHLEVAAISKTSGGGIGRKSVIPNVNSWSPASILPIPRNLRMITAHY